MSLLPHRFSSSSMQIQTFLPWRKFFFIESGIRDIFRIAETLRDRGDRDKILWLYFSEILLCNSSWFLLDSNLSGLIVFIGFLWYLSLAEEAHFAIQPMMRTFGFIGIDYWSSRVHPSRLCDPYDSRYTSLAGKLRLLFLTISELLKTCSML